MIDGKRIRIIRSIGTVECCFLMLAAFEIKQLDLVIMLRW